MAAGSNRKTVQSLATSYGKYFGALGAVVSPGTQSFLDGMDDRLLVMDKDLRASSYYAEVFSGAGTPALNSLLCVFQCLVNLVLELERCDADPRSVHTVLRLQFLMGFEVGRSLRELAGPAGSTLTRSSGGAVEAILEAIDEGAVFIEQATPLRNSLMHYDVHSRIPSTPGDRMQRSTAPGGGPGCTAEEFKERVVRTFEKVAARLNKLGSVAGGIEPVALVIRRWWRAGSPRYRHGGPRPRRVDPGRPGHRVVCLAGRSAASWRRSPTSAPS